MSHVLHLNKNGKHGMGALTACGRNLMRTPQSLSWSELKEYSETVGCEKCKASKYFALCTKMDNKKASAILAAVKVEESSEEEITEFTFGEWEPLSAEECEANEQILLARIRSLRK